MSLLSNLGYKLAEYRRVISISRKPSREEFVSIAKICGLGIVVIGVIGFVIQLIYQLIVTGAL